MHRSRQPRLSQSHGASRGTRRTGKPSSSTPEPCFGESIFASISLEFIRTQARSPQKVLLLALILEGDFHLSAVGHHLTVFYHEILLGNFGNAQFT